MSRKTRPPDPDALARGLDLAAAHFNAGRLEAAAQVYRRLERDAPQDVRAAYSLSVIDIRQNRLDRARRGLEAVTARAPSFAAAQHNLGGVRQQLGDWAGAADAYGRALALQPEAAGTRAALAAALTILGQGPEAIAQHRILAADPAQRWPALTRIALIDPAAIGDEDLAGMRAAALDPALDRETRAGLFFALGDVLETREAAEDAFDAYAAGNALKRQTVDVAAVAAANAAAARYVRDHAGQVGQGSASAAPIFIVGMPRSGSTLIEQILARHGEVQALGETGVLPDLMTDGYPKTSAGAHALATRYLAAMRDRGWNSASRFVDKTLENYLHVGLIAALFPKAVILHAVRDPIDTGFACYRQLFTGGNETLYDLADIAAEYVRYRELMDHWRAVAPGRVVDVAYESLVAGPEARIRTLLAEAGLAWDPAVLSFHDRTAAIRTASATQVRGPIYATSVQRWRRHAERLRPLIAGLGEYAEV